MKKIIFSNDVDGYIHTTFIFVEALSFILKEREGIVLHNKNDMKKEFPEVNQFLVYKENAQIHVEVFDSPILYDDGQIIWLDNIIEN